MVIVVLRYVFGIEKTYMNKVDWLKNEGHMVIFCETKAYVFTTVNSLRCLYEEYLTQNLSGGCGTVWCC